MKHDRSKHISTDILNAYWLDQASQSKAQLDKLTFYLLMGAIDLTSAIQEFRLFTLTFQESDIMNHVMCCSKCRSLYVTTDHEIHKLQPSGFLWKAYVKFINELEPAW